ncbi:hypothetical protein FISHEDRAFT_37371, partial [Fistulina hepatica ATCC 64428]
ATATISRPFVSSPLAGHASATRPVDSNPQRHSHHVFPASRALRPFPSIAASLTPKLPTTANARKQPTVKLIQPCKNQRGIFVLDLTQAELSRRD